MNKFEEMACYLIDRSISAREMKTNFDKSCEICTSHARGCNTPCQKCKVKIHYDDTIENINTISNYRKVQIG